MELKIEDLMKIKHHSEEAMDELHYRAVEENLLYNVTQGGYLKVEDILENVDDQVKVNNAIKTLAVFERSIAFYTEGC